jgi:putative aldouronate transport system substrate-binding protein
MGGFAGFYTAGLDDAFDMGYIHDLSQFADLMPNYIREITERGHVKLAYDHAGRMSGMNMMVGDPHILAPFGPIIREDWLADLGIDIPETVDEWTDMLRAFRDNYGLEGAFQTTGAAIPCAYDAGVFTNPWGGKRDWTHTNDVVSYGQFHESWFHATRLFAGWYEEGILNPYFTTDDGAMRTTRILNGEGGAFIGWIGAGLGTHMRQAREAGDDVFSLIGAPVPTLNKGEKPNFGHASPAFTMTSFVVTNRAQGDVLDAIIRMLDYGYTYDGWLLYNFGQESTSFYWENSEIFYTDLILRNPDGLSPAQALGGVARSSYGGPFVQAGRYIDLTMIFPQQVDAYRRFSNTNQGAHNILYTVSIPSELADEYSSTLTDCNTFIAEFTVLAIMGDKDFDRWEDEYIMELTRRGMPRVIEIYQQAYDIARGVR